MKLNNKKLDIRKITRLIDNLENAIKDIETVKWQGNITNEYEEVNRHLNYLNAKSQLINYIKILSSKSQCSPMAEATDLKSV